MTFTMTLPAGAERDSWLVRSARAGNRDSFGELYRRYARMVHGVLLARVPPADADDLLHEVFLTAMSRLPGLRDEDAFGGWLASIARRKAADLLRSSRETAELSGAERSRDSSAETRAEALHVLRIIGELPGAYRETLVLRLVEGFTGPQIAEHTGLTPDSVRVNLARGMKLLREKLAGRSPA
jgi:RNA polymerase sigma-70 factor, ECF subfamily